ncbi:MAG: RNA-binding protein [Alphaproteobacteria bacterium]|nr:RNA-binding protein [Alphaproteobacteria bacterium]
MPRLQRRSPPRPRSSATDRRAADTAALLEHPPARSPQRRCIVTGENRDRSALLRFVIGPDGEVVPDVAGRLPGRGLWLTPRRDIVERALAKRLFARAARRPVVAAPGLADRVEALLARRCCDALGLARRAGAAVAGFERVGEAVRREQAALLLVAIDGAEAARRKLAAIAGDRPVAVLSAAELGVAFGRERIVHAAIAGGTLCDRLRVDLQRLAGFRAGPAIEGTAVDSGFECTPAGPALQGGDSEAHD